MNLKNAPSHGRSTGTRGEPDHLAVEAVVAVMAACFAGVASVRAAREPAHPRASARPFDEGVDTCRLRHPAAILPSAMPPSA
jgi:hypothetical protein